MDDLLGSHYVAHKLLLSRPDSRSDSIGGSESSSGCETIYYDSLPVFFFFKVELVPVGYDPHLIT